MAIYITLNSGDFTIPEFGDRTLISPLVDYDLSQEFDEDEIRRSNTIQTAIDEGTITLKDSDFNIITNLNELQATSKSINSNNVDYVPNTPSDWDTIIPSLISDGLDQLASRIRFIEDNPSGTGTVTSISAGTGMSFTTITTTGSISIDTTKVPYLASGFSTGLLKRDGSSWVFDTNTYLTANQTITLSGDVTGSGTTAVTTSISNTTVTGKLLTGFTVDGNVTVTATDSILTAFNKVQGQLNARQPLDSTLTALASYNINGILTQTAADTFTGRTITGTINRISITNGSGVSGDPTVDIASTYVGQTSITTVGTITTGTWNGTAIGIANGGTGQTSANAALNALLPSQTGNSGKFLKTNGSNTSWSSNATPYQLNPSDPATTTSTTGVMMGLAASFTPIGSGNILIVISGDIDNSATIRGSQVQIRTGTGTAPANGAALTGTARGGLVKYNNPSDSRGGLVRVPFTCNAVVTGLSTGTTYWIDLSLASLTAGTSRVRDISISIIEL